MNKIKRIFKSFLNSDKKIYKFISRIYHFISRIKYGIKNHSKTKEKNKYLKMQIQRAINVIKSYKDKEYIVFYNPTWLGVANSTKGLFENIVPLEQVIKHKDVKNIAKCIIDSNIKTVIFSQIVDGWTEIIKEIKKMEKNICIKVIWHGNCYEFFSDYTWNLNKEVMELYKIGYIQNFGFVRSTMKEFYEKVGFKSYYLQNNVHLKKKNKEVKQKEFIKIGVYNADSRELKNIYTALSAIKLLPNAKADVVPINDGAKKFTEIINLEVTSIDNYISNEELLERILENDINLYPTFTENAPMFPLESFEMGIPCLLGNNNDYFCNTELGDYVIIKREDDPLYIKEKIIKCIDNKDKIMKLYEEWKKEFDIKCDKLVDNFINNI